MIDFAEEAKNNTNFRKVLQTTDHSQVVVMSLNPGEDIGMEAHPANDQAVFIASGEGKAVVDGEEKAITSGDLVAVQAGVQHNFINTSQTDMKIITIYSPANHAPNTIHATKADAQMAVHEKI